MEKGIFISSINTLWVIVVILLMVIYEFYTKNDDIYTYKKENQFSIENIPKDYTYRRSTKEFLEIEEQFRNRKLSQQNQIENKYLLKDGFWMKDYKDSVLPGRNVPRNYFVCTIYDILREMNRLQGSIDDHLRDFQDTSERFTYLTSLLRDLTPPGDDGDLIANEITGASVTNTSGNNGNVEPRSTDQNPVQASAGLFTPSGDHEGINTAAVTARSATNTSGHSDNDEPSSTEQTPVPVEASSGINTTEVTAGSVTNTFWHSDNDEPRSSNRIPVQASPGDQEGINTTAITAGPVTNTSGYSDEPGSSERIPVQATPDPRQDDTSNTTTVRHSLRNIVTSAEGPRIFHRNTVTSVSRLPNQNLDCVNNHNHVTTNIDIGRNAYRYPQFRAKSTRVATFEDCQLPTQTPEQMAEAGFIYVGYGDCVRCFVCGIGLRDWEPEDDPWIEHARWNPHCRYVLQSKGEDFIDLVRQLARMPNYLQQETPAIRQRETLNIGEVRRHQGQIIRNPLQSQAAQEVISQGYAPRAVREALDILVCDYGWHLLSAGLLVQILVSIGASRNTRTRQETTQKDGNDDRRHVLEENRRLKEHYTCKICLERNVEIIFLPCGHLCCCAQCAPALSDCPICRQRIKGTVKTHIV